MWVSGTKHLSTASYVIMLAMSTKFQQSVWKALASIPRGRVTTYGALSNFLGTKAVRAVGTALGKNPNAPQVPCHRVVLSDGSIGRYSGAGGVATKIKLLKSEGVEVKNSKVANFTKVFFDFKK